MTIILYSVDYQPFFCDEHPNPEVLTGSGSSEKRIRIRKHGHSCILSGDTLHLSLLFARVAKVSKEHCCLVN